MSTEMLTSAAVIKVLAERKISKYRMSKHLGVSAIMIDNYINGSRMRIETARRFKEQYGITITDVYGSQE